MGAGTYVWIPRTRDPRTSLARSVPGGGLSLLKLIKRCGNVSLSDNGRANLTLTLRRLWITLSFMQRVIGARVG